jgi:hypothetical protein
MWVGGSIKSFIVANTPPPMSTIPHGRRPGAARPAAGGRQPARHVGHVGHVASEFGPAGNRPGGRQAGAGSYQLPRHVLASDRAGSGQPEAKCTIEKSYRHPKAHNFALS